MYHNDRQSDDSFQLSLFYFLIDKEETFPVVVTVSPFHPRYGSFSLALLVYNLFSFRLLALKRVDGSFDQFPVSDRHHCPPYCKMNTQILSVFGMQA